MSNENTTVEQLLAKIAALEAKFTVKQTTASSQVLALPVGAMTAKCVKYTEYFPVYHLINPANPALGFVLQVGGAFAGRPKAFGFKKQNRKEIILTWANGAEVRFMKTQDSAKLHDSRTPTMAYGEAHVLAELKRVMGDDVKALKGVKWLQSVVEYNKEDDTTKYGKLKVDGLQTYGKVYGKKAKGPRVTAATVAASIPLSEEAAEGDSIPF